MTGERKGGKGPKLCTLSHSSRFSVICSGPAHEVRSPRDEYHLTVNYMINAQKCRGGSVIQNRLPCVLRPK